MSQIQDVKAANDIVTIIGERVTLKQAGSYLKGLCPFHSEKSPSFFVSPALQRYKCYGCQEGGDVLAFLQKYENLTFYESLQLLAERAGITLSNDVQTGEDRERAELLTILGLARDYYHFLLTKHRTGAAARQYLHDRQITTESIKVFQMGYSLNSWDGLVKYLHGKKKYPLELLVKAGLIVQGKYGRYYDRFRDRITFPLKDTRGMVVGFSGRLLSADAKEAKYINSPETLLYHKSKLLFGYSELKREIQKKRQVIVVEGEFDVISSAQANVNHVVAIKGSALTPDHAQLLARVADQIILSLDSDSAGIEATRKSIQVLRPFDSELRVVSLGEGKDPDELARKDPSAWRQAVKHNVSAYEFLINSAVAQIDITSPRAKRTVIKQLAPILWSIESQVERELYLEKLAAALKADKALVTADVQLFAKTPSASVTPQLVPTATKKSTRLENLETYVVFLLMRSPADQLSAHLRVLRTLVFLPSHLKQLLSYVPESVGIFNWNHVQSQLPADFAQYLMDAMADPQLAHMFDVSDWDKEWQRTIDELSQELKRERREQIARQLDALTQGAPTSDMEQTQAQLLAELARL